MIELTLSLKQSIVCIGSVEFDLQSQKCTSLSYPPLAITLSPFVADPVGPEPQKRTQFTAPLSWPRNLRMYVPAATSQ